MASELNPSVLLVDDDGDSREMYALFLSMSGIQVVQAADGVEAFERAVEHRPLVIVTDLRLPRMDGLELCAALQADERTRGIAVMAVTGFTLSQKDLERAENIGFKTVLTKPCLPERLLTELSNLIEQTRETRRMASQI